MPGEGVVTRIARSDKPGLPDQSGRTHFDLHPTVAQHVLNGVCDPVDRYVGADHRAGGVEVAALG
jgi:hypothetical protein